MNAPEGKTGKLPRRAARAPTSSASPIAAADRLRFLTSMIEIREFEEQVQRSYLEGLVHGTTHLCQGQEAVSVGAIGALREDDFISYTYRSHGHCIARGMDMEAAFAELFGRATGICGGLGGSMHLQDVGKGLIGSFGIVGAGLPVATGVGVSAQLNGRGQVSMAFFGDGACNIGAFHESMNIAQVWRLPVIFVCENNLYGEYSRIEVTTPFEDLVNRARAYAMQAAMVDGNDVEAVYGAVSPAVMRARDGGGPSFIECKTYRQRGHSRSDPATYRPKQEVEAWLGRDPIATYRARLVEAGLLSFEDADQISRDVRTAVEGAAKRAATAPWPEPNQDFDSRMLA